MPQTFLSGDSYGVRDGLVTYIRRDLLGPWDGETETLPGSSSGPRDRYLVGMLGPRPHATTSDGIALAAAQSADSESGDEGKGDDSEPRDHLTPQAAGHIWASSMGLSFTVPASVGTLSVTARWGRYTQSEEATDQGTTRKVWAREPVEYPVDIDVTSAAGRTVPLEGAIVLDVQVRHHSSGSGEDLRIVELALVNGQEDSRDARDARWLFQVGIEVTAFPDDQAAVFFPVDDPLDPANRGNAPEDPEDRRLRLLYRDSLSHANGRNVAVHAHVRDGERNAHRLATTWLPEYDVRATTAPTVQDLDLLRGLELGMDELAEMAVPGRGSELSAALAPLADGYAAWLEQQRRSARSLPEDLRESALVAIEQALEICDRITLGIDTLAADDTALAAFRFANRAMALQRRNTSIATARAGREDDNGSYREARDEVYDKGKEGASWRPFQLAFVLLNLASLSAPGHPHRGTGREALVDLLFFPTGGGKTEAYLGLAAYTFALRRLQGTIGSGAQARSGEAGVGVLMRYTLRLLTAQQFQRAAALVTACEVLRREEFARDVRWGATPFRIGLWVGTSVSPNWFDEAKEQIMRRPRERKRQARQGPASPHLPVVRERSDRALPHGVRRGPAPGPAVLPARRGTGPMPVLEAGIPR